ncbi:MAG: FAD-binding oxidoreductase [Myxococcota bacterium]|nr:FAD-binding oxidoreductase [Myxococcota bacterium]
MTGIHPWLAALEDVVGPTNVRQNDLVRRAYRRDLWPSLQLKRLSNTLSDGPDAVVWPATATEVAGVLRVCRDARVAVVPYGAGSGVCGGAASSAGQVVIDLKRLKNVRSFDRENQLVEVEAGLMGERFERWLNDQGCTLGHFPSSILCSTVGGWLAGRSAGQCSSRYGKIEDMVVRLEVVTPDGQIRTTERHTYGPDWTQVFVGSEGTLGVITAAQLRIHQFPQHRAFGGWFLPTIDDGLTVMRDTMQDGLKPAVLRLYDPLDTKMVGASPNGTQGAQASLLKGLLAGQNARFKHLIMRRVLGWSSVSNSVIRTWQGPVLLVAMTEGQPEESEATFERLSHHASQRPGAQYLGEQPGRDWLAHRYDVSYKQSRIYKMGAFVDTFEVATTWDRVVSVYEAVRRACAAHVVVMAHFSHVYAGGCSIYFTFAGSAPSIEKMQAKYAAAWQSGLDAALDAGAAIAHHHGVGISRIEHMGTALGDGIEIFRALKKTFDPSNIMNPGKVMRL